MNYDTITFTTGGKDISIPLFSILSQNIKPKNIFLVIDTRWGGEQYKEKIEWFKLIFKTHDINFVIYESNADNFFQLKNDAYFKLIESEFVLYVEDDCWIPYNYAEKLLTIMQDNTVGACGGCQQLVMDTEDFIDPPIFEYIHLEDATLYQRLYVKDGRLIHDGPKHQVYTYYEKKVIPAMALIHTYMLRMQALKEIGGWDEQAPQNGSLLYEEVDVTLNMYVHSYKVMIDTELIMWHLRYGHHNRDIDKSSKKDYEQQLMLERELYFGNKYKNKI